MQVDSKKDLEKALKGVCEAFIMALTKVRAAPPQCNTVPGQDCSSACPTCCNRLRACGEVCMRVAGVHCSPLSVNGVRLLAGGGGAHAVVHYQGHGCACRCLLQRQRAGCQASEGAGALRTEH